MLLCDEVKQRKFYSLLCRDYGPLAEDTIDKQTSMGSMGMWHTASY